MRNLKKILALVLALVMSLSLMATAGAASFPDVADDNAYKTAIEVLNGVEVLQGYDNGARFEPKGAITRAEAAAVIYRIATGDVNDTQKDIYTAWNGAGKLSDVSGWYAGYVNYCCNAGYIKGYPNGTFQAQNNVTGYEVLAMVLRAMGYGRNGEFSGSQWAITVGSLAQTLGITKNITETLGEPATREMVAEIVFRAIFCETQMYNALHLYEGTGTNLARENLKLEEVEGVVMANEYANLEGVKTLADGKTLVRDEKNEKDYTINQVTTLDDIGESRMIYIQNKTDVISLADSGHNVKDETLDEMKVSDLLSRANLDGDAAEKFLNFDKSNNRDSAYKIKYVLVFNDLDDAQNAAASINAAAGLSGRNAIAPVLNDAKTAWLVTRTIERRTPITSVDLRNIEGIFSKADLESRDDGLYFIDGEVYVGTQSTNDISDVKADQKYSYESFYEEFIEDDVLDASYTANERGNWLKVIDNDADGDADYILKVVYTVAQVSGAKDDKITLDTKNHTLRGTRCDGNDWMNDLTSEKVVSADTLEIDDVVYYAIIEDKAQTYKAEVVSGVSFNDVKRNESLAVTTDGVEYYESGVHEHIEDEAYDSGIRNLAGRTSYDIFLDRGGYLAAFVKPTASNFSLILDGWFYQAKTGREYAVKAYNDETGKQDTIDINENGSLFISGNVRGVQNNDWGALKFLGDTDESMNIAGTVNVGGALVGYMTVAGTPTKYYPAALNGGTIGDDEDASTWRNSVHTTMAAITEDGTILPVHDSAISGRYDHDMIDLYTGTAPVLPTNKYVKGDVYTTYEARNTDTAYDTKGDTVEIVGLTTTVYYVVYPANGGYEVIRTVGYSNAPALDSFYAKGWVEDVYAVGTKRISDNALKEDDIYYTADAVVIELNKYTEAGELVLVLDDESRLTNVWMRDVLLIDAKGEKVNRLVDLNGNRMAYSDNQAGNKRILPGIYRMFETNDTSNGQTVYTISDRLTPAQIAATGVFTAGQVSIERGTIDWNHITVREWTTDTQAAVAALQVKNDFGWYEYDEDLAGTINDNADRGLYATSDAKLWKVGYGYGTSDRTYETSDNRPDVEEATAQEAFAPRINEVLRRVSSSAYDGREAHEQDDLQNWTGYFFNDVLIRHDTKGNMVWAVSFDEMYSEGRRDYAQTVWNNVVPAPAGPSGHAITIYGQLYNPKGADDAAKWTSTELTGTVKVAEGTNTTVDGNVAYTSTKNGVEIKLTAPAGYAFYAKDTVGVARFDEAALGAEPEVFEWKFTNSRRNATIILDGITSDMDLYVGLLADPTNYPTVTVKTSSKDNEKVTTSATISDLTTKINNFSITLLDKVGAAIDPVADKLKVTGVTYDGKPLKENTDYIVSGDKVVLKEATDAKYILADIVVEATINRATEDVIRLVAAAGVAYSTTGSKATTFGVYQATYNNGTKDVEVRPVGYEKTTGAIKDVSSLTYKVPAGKALTVALLTEDGYPYSDVATISKTAANATTTFTVSAAVTDVVVIDSAARYENAVSDTAPKFDGVALTKGHDTEAEALGDVETVTVDSAEKATPTDAANITSSDKKTVKAEDGSTVTVYKVIAEDKTVKYYAVKVVVDAESGGDEPSKPEVVPPVEDVVGAGTPVTGDDAKKIDVTSGYQLPAGVTASEQEVISAATHKVTSDSITDTDKVVATKQTDEGQAIAVEKNAAFESVAIEQVKDTQAAPKAGEAKVTWKITITLAKPDELSADGVAFKILVIAKKTQEQGTAIVVTPIDEANVSGTDVTIADPADKATQKYVIVDAGTEIKLTDAMNATAAAEALGNVTLENVPVNKTVSIKDATEGKILVVLEFAETGTLTKVYTYTVPAAPIVLTLSIASPNDATLKVEQDGKEVTGDNGAYTVAAGKDVTITITPDDANKDNYKQVTCGTSEHTNCLTWKQNAADKTWSATIAGATLATDTHAFTLSTETPSV